MTSHCIGRTLQSDRTVPKYCLKAFIVLCVVFSRGQILAQLAIFTCRKCCQPQGGHTWSHLPDSFPTQHSKSKMEALCDRVCHQPPQRHSTSQFLSKFPFFLFTCVFLFCVENVHELCRYVQTFCLSISFFLSFFFKFTC